MQRVHRIKAASVPLVFALALGTAACGREGAIFGPADPERFCAVAARLEREATVAFGRLDPSDSITALVDRLRSFINDHRADYAELDNAAPAQVIPFVQRQRLAQQELLRATGPFDQVLAYRATVANGRKIREYRAQACPRI